MKGKKLNVDVLTQTLTSEFGNNFVSSVRVTYYFRRGDSRIAKMLEIPDLHGLNGHWQIKECGQNVKGSKAIPTDQIDRLDEEYRDLYPRAEKGLDMELACDSLSFAASGRVQCFVFLINDRDYLPLLTSIQRLGANTYVVSLDVKDKVQDEILKLSDRYVTLETYLSRIFEHTPLDT